MQDNNVRNAVRSLRKALELTQTDFGRLLGKSLPTIQRWETLRPPRGRALAQLFDLAKQHSSKASCDAAAAIFHAALTEEMGGTPLARGFSLPQEATFTSDIHPQTSEEARRVAALLAAMRDANGEQEVEKFDRAFKRRLAQMWNMQLVIRKEKK